MRTLLSDVTRTWRQKELVQRTGVSSGLVSRFYVPKGEGVFLKTREVEGLPLVTDTQIDADLKKPACVVPTKLPHSVTPLSSAIDPFDLTHVSQLLGINRALAIPLLVTVEGVDLDGNP